MTQLATASTTMGTWSRHWATRRENPLATPSRDEESELTPEERSEENFRRLAREQPSVLLTWIQTKLRDRPDLLTFAAEAVGLIPSSADVVAALEPLLRHEKAFVREGAIYGLTPHLNASLQARDLLRDAAQTETSDGVREAINEALSTLD